MSSLGAMIGLMGILHALSCRHALEERNVSDLPILEHECFIIFYTYWFKYVGSRIKELKSCLST